jgi:esterase/lipase superfamily enzyme
MNKNNLKFIIKIIFINLVICNLTACNFFHRNLGETEILQKKLQPTWQKIFKNNYDDDFEIKIMIATNRLRKSADFGCGDENFGVDFDKIISYGSCNIKVSKFHKIGDISPAKDSKENDNFKIISSKDSREQDFFNAIKNLSATPLVFIHGFNVKYNEAILRAVQIAYDLKYQ